jgi:uncharacterized protein (TIGR01777 family)
MTIVLILMTIQCALGAFDNLWHHELTEALPSKPTARLELSLHTAREFIYAALFMGIAWYRLEGNWALGLVVVLAIEIVITLWDFVVEDQTRRLPRFERVLHTILAINFGAVAAELAPVLLQWGHERTGIAAVSYGVWSWLFTFFSIGVLAWAIRDLYAVISLGVPEWQRHPIQAGHNAAARTILITGATGFIGRRLVRSLIEKGDHVVALSRDPAKAAWTLGPHVEVVGDLSHITRERPIDAIVNLAGEPLAGGLWTKARKTRFFTSRVGTTEALVALIRRLDRKPTVLVSASAVGFYGDNPDDSLDEDSPPQPHILSEICRQWEAAGERAAEMGVRVCRIRIGFVLGLDGGAFPALAAPVRFGLGTTMGTGRQWMSWIHIDDMVSLLQQALDNDALNGAINAVAPEPVTHGEFMQAVSNAARRPLFLRMPAKLLRLAIGEFADLFLVGQKVIPAAAVAAGYTFKFPSLNAALSDLINEKEEPDTGSTMALYNEDCSICAKEINHYCVLAEKSQACVRFVRIGETSETLRAFGLTDREARRRLFVLDRRGQLRSGVEAFAAIWHEIPNYRPLAVAIALPGIKQLAFLLYEGVMVPILDVWNRQTSAIGRPEPREGHGS